MRLIERGEDTREERQLMQLSSVKIQELKTKVVTPWNRYKQKFKDGVNRAWLPRAIRDEFLPWVTEVKYTQFMDAGNQKKVVFLFYFIYLLIFYWWGSIDCFASLYNRDTSVDILKKYAIQKFWNLVWEWRMKLYKLKLGSRSCLLSIRKAIQAEGIPWKTDSECHVELWRRPNGTFEIQEESEI